MNLIFSMNIDRKRMSKKILLLILVLLFSQRDFAQTETNRIISLQRQGQNIPLQVKDAFPYHLSIIDPINYQATWQLAPGHYLYGHAFEFRMIQGQNNLELPLEFELPMGVNKKDQFFGDVLAFYDNISISLTLPAVPLPEARIIIEYQGCADWGFCYPLQRDLLMLSP